MTLESQAVIVWIYRGPSLVLTALIGLMVLRFLLVVLGGNSSRLVPGLLQSLTNPIARLVRWLTPAAVPDALVLVLASVWLVGVRIVWLYACIAGGLRPSLGG